ncbi:MAG: DUF2807 domain-containing protein [Bacteroidia bacterium]|nr:DUF2807 domain-containing protein [Bacteroidia bacterium]
MKKNIVISFLVLITTLISCNAQQVQNREVKSFHKIQASGSVNIHFTQSDTASLTVKADKDEIENVETKFENGVLVISNKGRFTDPVNIYVKNSLLSGIETSGAVDLKISRILKTDSLEINASGSSDIHAKVETRKIKCLQSGASDVSLDGTTDHLESNVSSAATLKSYNMVSKNADIITTGAATAKIYVTEKLVANASGASDIKIKGDPKEVNAESSTASSITKIKEVSSAQGKSNKDTTVYNWKHKKVLVVKKDNDGDFNLNNDDNEGKHWRGFALGINGYLSPDGISLPKSSEYMKLDYAHSFNLQFNFMERQFNLHKNYIKLITGMGFDYHSYDLVHNTTLNPDSSFTYGMIDSTNTVGYKKNRFRMTYLQVPLLFEFNTRNDHYNSYHLAIGVVGQYILTSRTRQIISSDGAEYTKVRRDSYNLSPFGLKAHLSFGYRDFQIWGEYSLTPLFQAGHGPELNPMAIGVRWSFS